MYVLRFIHNSHSLGQQIAVIDLYIFKYHLFLIVKAVKNSILSLHFMNLQLEPVQRDTGYIISSFEVSSKILVTNLCLFSHMLCIYVLFFIQIFYRKPQQYLCLFFYIHKKKIITIIKRNICLEFIVINKIKLITIVNEILLIMYN